MRVRVASAGTGKTTSLVLRVLQGVAAGVPLRRVAAVTFTRAAAAELRGRVHEGLHLLLRDGTFLEDTLRLEEVQLPRFEEALREIGGARMETIHGFMRGMLRALAPALALDPDFVAAPEPEARASFEESLRSLLLLAQAPDHPLAAAATALGGEVVPWGMALFEQRALGPRLRPADAGAEALWRFFAAAYDDWWQRMGVNRLPPAETERFALRAATSPHLAARLVARTGLLLVDEFQDVNPLQGELFEALEGAGMRVEVVGDPKQAIYAFRHADVAVFRRAAARAQAEGTLQPPLRETRRHTPAVARLLNHLTEVLAEHQLGFGPSEAEGVTPVGPRAALAGRVELHWWRDEGLGLARLREAEFAELGKRLQQHANEGRAWTEMAVIARSHAVLERAAARLRGASVPVVLRQGRGFYARAELRDLRVALHAGLDPSGLPLAAFLRGPFVGLGAAAAMAVARADTPLVALQQLDPELATRFAKLRDGLRADPPQALAHLAYSSLDGGVPFVARLSRRARDNVDALVVTFAARPPADLERALLTFDNLARESEAGDVPQAGEGVTLLTVHAAKGLEWPLVAVIDAGGKPRSEREPLEVDPDLGTLATHGGEQHAPLARARSERLAGEQMRMLYVALSRPQEVLIVTGSQGAGEAGPWLRAFHLAGLGPAGEGRRAEVASVARALGVSVALHPALEVPPVVGMEMPTALASRAPWMGDLPPVAAFPAVVSPSWVLLEGAGRAPEGRIRARWPAPLVAPGDDPEERQGSLAAEGERFAGRGTAIGTLVHDALARAEVAPGAAAQLRGQEVLFGFPEGEKGLILAEVEELLAGYRRLVAAGGMTAIGEGEREQRELAFAFEAAGSTWHGVIDRLSYAEGVWWLDDYKTDRALSADRYHFALACYVEAVERARGVRPRARLVDLRTPALIEVPDAALRAAWVERLGRAAG
jgi:ATP-dependent helicase/nuclease subunit A